MTLYSQDVTICRARVVTALDSSGQSRIIKRNFEHNHKPKFLHRGVSLSHQLSIIEGSTLLKKSKSKGSLPLPLTSKSA